ncbi:MAG: hypothetical protein WC477_01495 [Patescibacteria group bacterium]
MSQKPGWCDTCHSIHVPGKCPPQYQIPHEHQAAVTIRPTRGYSGTPKADTALSVPSAPMVSSIPAARRFHQDSAPEIVLHSSGIIQKNSHQDEEDDPDPNGEAITCRPSPMHSGTVMSGTSKDDARGQRSITMPKDPKVPKVI